MRIERGQRLQFGFLVQQFGNFPPDYLPLLWGQGVELFLSNAQFVQQFEFDLLGRREGHVVAKLLGGTRGRGISGGDTGLFASGNIRILQLYLELGEGFFAGIIGVLLRSIAATLLLCGRAAGGNRGAKLGLQLGGCLGSAA
ncbi:hypothetical protein D3C80_1057380 [compost metagenome]